MPSPRYSFHLLLLLACMISVAAQGAAGPRTVLIVLDGLRPDYVTEDGMPNVFRIRQEGLNFTNHHSTYPTVTRVNATTISTGCYPGKHGVMDNTIYVKAHDAEKTFSTSSREHLEAIDASLGGTLVLTPTLAEILEAAGQKLLVVSSGSAGSAFLLNHKAKGHGIINGSYTLPATHQTEIDALLGAAPEESYPNAALNAYVVDAYLQYALPKLDPDVTLFWLSDPDHTAHRFGMGAPKTVEALKAVDGEVGRIVEGLRARGLIETTNLILTSDHGFSTHTGKYNPLAEMRQFVESQGVPADSLVSAGFGIYLREQAETITPKLVERMQGNKWIGPIFTRAAAPGSAEGWAPGTLSMELIHYQNDRAPDILFSPQWNDGVNSHGFAGETLTIGVAGHGGASTWDVHNTLIASGPAFKKAAISETPTHNVDLAATILALQGLPAPAHMDGRVLQEGFLAGGEAAAIERKTVEVKRAMEGGGAYRAVLHQSVVGGSAYFDAAEGAR
ncbi:MAG: alkaline phosphatase family protein [Candidatus Hydrogenedentes bacterium]|nr:alkaline phosphatase family protein [Candidatus Hydrogenedentota bacterium]